MRHIISILLENEAGALSRVSGLFSARGYNIETLTVAPTEDVSLSRLTIVTTGSDEVIEQITKQLNKLIDVVKVVDLSEAAHIERELMLIKVRATGKDREEMKRLADIFRGHIIDVTDSAYVIELTGTSNQLDSFVAAIDPVLILETVRAASAFAISDRDVYLEKVRSASQLRQAEAAKETKRRLNKEKKRISELDTIIKKLYESFAVGRITGERFDSLLAEYEAEQKALTASVSEMETQMSVFAEDTDRAKQFLELARKYTDFSELTTPMINEFIEKIIVHAPERIDGDRVQEVEIHLRFIGQFELPAPELTEEEIKRQEQLKRHRIKSRERYQKIKAGEHAVGQPFMLTCKCCGQEFASKRTNTLFCGPNCRAKFYRQEAAESRSRACTCENCGKEFITTRSDVKYCSDDCRYAAQIKRQSARKKALREAKNEKETKTA